MVIRYVQHTVIHASTLTRVIVEQPTIQEGGTIEAGRERGRILSCSSEHETIYNDPFLSRISTDLLENFTVYQIQPDQSDKKN